MNRFIVQRRGKFRAAKNCSFWYVEGLPTYKCTGKSNHECKGTERTLKNKSLQPGHFPLFRHQITALIVTERQRHLRQREKKSKLQFVLSC